MKMKQLLSTIDSVNRFIGEIFSFMVLAIFAVTLFEVIARFVFNHPTNWGQQSVALMFSIYVLLLGGYCLLCNSHIRVDVIWGKLSFKGKAIADLVSSVFIFLFLIVFFWYSVVWAAESFRLHERSWEAWSIPIYPFKAILPIGVFLLLLQSIAKFIRDIYAVLGKDRSEIKCSN